MTFRDFGLIMYTWIIGGMRYAINYGIALIMSVAYKGIFGVYLRYSSANINRQLKTG